MLTRRDLLAAGPLAAFHVLPADAGAGFEEFLSGVAREARDRGVSSTILHAALAGLQPNAKVLQLDRNQAEFTQTWQHYRDTRLSPARIVAGRSLSARNADLLAAIGTRFQIDPSVIMGIWGMETNYGSFTGGFNVIEALATLAWDGRRAGYFRAELLAALGILQAGDVSVPRMLGSYAGAMGQPQFMPTSFDRYSIDFDDDGRRDIWDDRADALASIANYLAKSGWSYGDPWGFAVSANRVTNAEAGTSGRAPITAWSRRGVRLADGGLLPDDDVEAYLVLPAGVGGQAFLAYPNFAAIRRYNPSDFYALAVGMLGDAVTS